jgi:hypothetical protein
MRDSKIMLAYLGKVLPVFDEQKRNTEGVAEKVSAGDHNTQGERSCDLSLALSLFVHIRPRL